MTATPAEHWTPPLVAPTHQAELHVRLRHAIDHKTKPLGALGQLEDLALQLGLIQAGTRMTLTQPQMVVFAADHGLATEGVSAYPQAVTLQMVLNMAQGGAAVNVLARQHGFGLTVVDAGVASHLPEGANTSTAQTRVLIKKGALGTGNMLHGPAMCLAQCLACLRSGEDVVRELPGNVVAFGEMGIGNTSSAALLLARLAGLPLEDVVGRGTGLNDLQLDHKLQVLRRVDALHAQAQTPLQVLVAMGGFELAMMAGAMLQAASERRVVLVDGFIAGAAALVACALQPHTRDYLVFAHRSAESGHRLMLAHLHAQPLLDLGLRLGEGSGALLAWPLVQSAACLLNDMASFESAGVSQADPVGQPPADANAAVA